MADWKDVTEARAAASDAYGAAQEYMANASVDAEAVARSNLAVAAELRALGTTIDYALVSLARVTGRP